ncbi:MAG: mechanosensitive ion channel family protein [Oligoflexia bacterium]|nr:mechanosensitive ion channel family protein [Oligoflexia bacterium]
MMGNSWLFLFSVIIAGLLLSRYLRPFVNLIIKKLSYFLPEDIQKILTERNKTAYSLLIFWLVCNVGFQFASIEEKWEVFLSAPLKFILAASILLLIWNAIDILENLVGVNLQRKRELGAKDSITKNILPYSKKILKTLVFTIIALIFLQNIGFKVTSLLAGLGIGGMALALAAKETLSNFFGGISVILDKPFAVGDWIVCKDIEGTVEDIGFRSTKVKTFYDSLITIPNSILSDSVIDNLGKRQARRTRVTLDITYDTAPEKVEAFVEGLKQIIKSNSHTRKDYYQCYFSGYGPHSLQIFLNFFLKVSDWDTELLQKQNIFLEILRLAKELEVDFAFPTQSLDLLNIPGQKERERKSFSAEELKNTAQSFGPQGALSQPQGLGLYKPKN